MHEASIEWVQVAPEYQKRGIGRALVCEVLRRLDTRAAFVTAAGEVEDRDNPGAFFRRCGFTGQDVWWLLGRT
jgi:ribosomal protein S18 acetylase RimI-like enzyme